MCDWSPDADGTKSGWLWLEATLVTTLVILGYVALGWAVYDWLTSHLARLSRSQHRLSASVFPPKQGKKILTHSGAVGA